MFVKGGYCYFIHGERGKIIKNSEILIAGDYYVNGVRGKRHRTVCGAFIRLEKTFIKDAQRGSIN